MRPYDYIAPDSRFETRLAATSASWSRYEVSFPTVRPTKFKEGDTVFGDYFATGGAAPSPLVILVPGVDSGSLVPCLMLARHLVREGISAFVLHLVFQPPRAPESMRGKVFYRSSDEWLEGYSVLVTDVRRVIDWAETRKEIDSSKICVTGVSIGGMVAVITMAVDTRVASGVFIASGGNLKEIAWSGTSPDAKIGHLCTREECYEIYNRFPEYLKEVAEKGIDKVIPVKECFLFEPLTFAPFIRGRSILMINGENDEIVPRRSTLELWESCGRPPITWLPGGHFSIYSQIPLISKEIVRFLGK